MERSRVILTDRDRQQQQQQQQERERQENHCIDTEQAVTKHFEESLRRAKEKVSVILLPPPTPAPNRTEPNDKKFLSKLLEYFFNYIFCRVLLLLSIEFFIV